METSTKITMGDAPSILEEKMCTMILPVFNLLLAVRATFPKIGGHIGFI
jgi:hypothetical protein